MSAPVLLVLGPNPAWQKTLFFDAFRPGQVNRAHRLEEFASGKGINFWVVTAGRPPVWFNFSADAAVSRSPKHSNRNNCRPSASRWQRPPAAVRPAWTSRPKA